MRESSSERLVNGRDLLGVGPEENGFKVGRGTEAQNRLNEAADGLQVDPRDESFSKVGIAPTDETLLEASLIILQLLHLSGVQTLSALVLTNDPLLVTSGHLEILNDLLEESDGEEISVLIVENVNRRSRQDKVGQALVLSQPLLGAAGRYDNEQGGQVLSLLQVLRADQVGQIASNQRSTLLASTAAKHAPEMIPNDRYQSFAPKNSVNYQI